MQCRIRLSTVRRGMWFAVGLVAVVLAIPGSAQSVVAGSNGKIAFDRDGKNGQNNIWSMSPDGSGQAQLTQSGYNSSAAWSPDGTKLAFQRSTNFGLHFEIFLMRPDGTGLTQLTSNATNSSFNPTWSPDGTKIAFGSGPDGGSVSDIYVINSDGSGLTNLTNDSTHFNVSPAWSPDGTKIAFGSARDGSEDIWVMNADGTAPSNLTGTFTVALDGRLSQERWPAWSPVGNKIAFYTNHDGLSLFHIYVMDSVGTNAYAQTTGSFDFNPTWSPDGSKIAFASFRNGNNDIYVMDATAAESGFNMPVNRSNVGATHSAIRPNWAVVPTPCGKKVCHF